MEQLTAQLQDMEDSIAEGQEENTTLREQVTAMTNNSA